MTCSKCNEQIKPGQMTRTDSKTHAQEHCNCSEARNIKLNPLSVRVRLIPSWVTA